MYVWISKSIVVNSSRIIMVIDCNENSPCHGCSMGNTLAESRKETPKTAIILEDGTCLLADINKEAVVRKIKQCWFDRTGV